MKTVCRKEYNEILEILKHIPSYDYFKIPDEKIEFFKTYSVKDYDFKIENINDAKISRETFAIYTSLYRDYIATNEEKEKINEILLLNQKRKEEKYSSKKLFNSKKENEKLVKVEKISLLKKILNNLKSIFSK